ncbi:prostate-associated microseminoprotein-like isoform X1 [Stegostoma tigrinum]|uniref:prostate-associated microseminoprotein-like isoform X1 n=1 Tax=Stegostoma tigrinum TaxID=3053191 RepID=UPI00202B3A82|nr:prostate-associated microseminoprotein-like isoform X1 [Stegostoma tigrinum]
MAKVKVISINQGYWNGGHAANRAEKQLHFTSNHIYLSLSTATCEHKGVRLETGDIWINEDCYQCICLNPFGVGCCDKVSQPVDYPDWCEVIQRPNSCLLAVVMKANHKIACISKTTMGRLRPRYGYKEGENPFFEQWRA